MSNQCVLVCLQPFSLIKQAISMNWIKNDGGDLLWDGAAPTFIDFFFTAFARTRGIDVRMIMPTEYLLPRAVFCDLQKLLKKSSKCTEMLQNEEKEMKIRQINVFCCVLPFSLNNKHF